MRQTILHRNPQSRRARTWVVDRPGTTRHGLPLPYLISSVESGVRGTLSVSAGRVGATDHHRAPRSLAILPNDQPPVFVTNTQRTALLKNSSASVIARMPFAVPSLQPQARRPISASATIGKQGRSRRPSKAAEVSALRCYAHKLVNQISRAVDALSQDLQRDSQHGRVIRWARLPIRSNRTVRAFHDTTFGEYERRSALCSLQVLYLRAVATIPRRHGSVVRAPEMGPDSPRRLTSNSGNYHWPFTFLPS